MGYLYFGLGDGGSGERPERLRPEPDTRLLGKMLRIDVVGRRLSRVPGYRIPADNPIRGNAKCGPASNAASCPEIYA